MNNNKNFHKKKQFKHKKPYNPIEIKTIIYQEGQYKIVHLIEHEKGWVGYGLVINEKVELVTLDIEKIFDVLTPNSRGDSTKEDLVNSAKARIHYTTFKETVLPKSTYLSQYKYK